MKVPTLRLLQIATYLAVRQLHIIDALVLRPLVSQLRPNSAIEAIVVYLFNGQALTDPAVSVSPSPPPSPSPSQQCCHGPLAVNWGAMLMMLEQAEPGCEEPAVGWRFVGETVGETNDT
jgi:hypothetical protein